MGDRQIAAAAERWAKLHRDELVRDLIGLIRIPSIVRYGEGGAPMGLACRDALRYMQGLAQQYGMTAENHEDYCLSILLPGKEPGRELGILGHADVVPQGTGWTYEPFAGIEKNGYVIGRGSADNKGAVIMALHALRCMRELDIQPRSTVRLIIGCDEERDMRDIRHYLRTHEPPAFTLNCDGTWSVGIGEKGLLTAELALPLPGDSLLEIGGGEASNMVPSRAWFRLRGMDEPLYFTGKAAHCAAPAAGDNAIRRMLQALCKDGRLTGGERQAITLLAGIMKDDEGTALGIRYADRLSGQTTCVGSRLCVQEHALRLQIDVRSAVTQPMNLLVRRLRESCKRLGLTVENLTVQAPRYTDPDQPEIRILLDTCREFVSRRHRPYVSGGGTYSRLFPRSVPFGVIASDKPRVFGGPHAADEAVCVDELLQAIKVYAVALMRLDSFIAKKGKACSDGE